MKPPLENNPIRHIQKIKTQMRQIIAQLRQDVGLVTDPKARALFANSAEVLTGLVQSFDDYEKVGQLSAWHPSPNGKMVIAGGKDKRRTAFHPR
jgi:hypothetical protein